MHASTTHCNSCARMLLSPAQLLACARGRRRRSAAPALAYSSARPWRARHGCSISGQKRILHARMHAPPTQCSSCARMLLSPTQLFACLHAHACAAAALQLLRSSARPWRAFFFSRQGVLIAEFYLVDRGLRHRLPGFSSLDRPVVLTQGLRRFRCQLWSHCGSCPTVRGRNPGERGWFDRN